MDTNTARIYLQKNKEAINYSWVAKQLGMDISNFHKYVKGDINISEKRLKKLNIVLEKLCPKV